MPAPQPLRLVNGVTDGGDGHDPWDLDGGGGYSSNNFYVASTDKKGHGETLYLKVPPAIQAEIAALVADKVFGAYRTPQDFFRDAIYHRIKYLRQPGVTDKLERVSDIEAVQERLARAQAELERLAAIPGRFKELIENAIRQEDFELADDMIQQAERQADEIREPYRSKLEVVVREAVKELRGKRKGRG